MLVDLRGIWSQVCYVALLAVFSPIEAELRVEKLRKNTVVELLVQDGSSKSREMPMDISSVKFAPRRRGISSDVIFSQRFMLVGPIEISGTRSTEDR